MSDKEHESSIGEAYCAGLRDAVAGNQPHNPYYENTQQFRAYVSGYRDQVAWQAENGRA